MSDSKLPTVFVRISFDQPSRQWIATCDEPSLRVATHAYSKARRRIKRAVEEAMGTKVRIEEKISLPPALALELRRYQRRHAAARALAAYVRDTRRQLARDLVALQISQADVAGFVKMSPQALAVLLSDAKTAYVTACAAE